MVEITESELIGALVNDITAYWVRQEQLKQQAIDALPWYRKPWLDPGPSQLSILCKNELARSNK